MSLVVAGQLDGAIAHRTWTLRGPAPRLSAFLVRAGECVLALDRARPAAIAAPALVWLPASARGTVTVRAGSGGFTAAIDPDFMQRTLGETAATAPLGPLLDRVFVCGAGAVAPYLAALAYAFEALAVECRAMRPGAQAMLGLHLGLIAVSLWRAAGEPDLSRPHGMTTVQKFRQLVELHYREGLRIDDFARRLGVSRDHLHDACVRATGLTPLALLHERLLAEARARLAQTGLSVEQVGYGIGFRDAAYFSRFFKRGTGLAPGAYRRAAQSARAVAPPSFAAWP